MRRTPRNKKVARTFLPSPPSEKLLHEFGSASNLPGLNALVIGSAIFETEQALRERRVRKVTIPVYHSGELDYDLPTIGKLIHELLIFALVEDIAVDFLPVRLKTTSAEATDRDRKISNICLFSGGQIPTLVFC